ncbi:MAG: NAD-dependent protein deacetylase [Propionibacteriales bacterium]|nr:NAD-dependent protein deacetylase [Propionibacteriales bacterium]
MCAFPDSPARQAVSAYPRLRHRPAPPPADAALGDPGDLREFVARHPRLLVLTGAGCSTESGIPDYRDVTGAWKRQTPVEYLPFMRDPLMRSRYWARSLIGWRSFGGAAPNTAHHALASLERSGRVSLLVTQNVDGLHQAAGSRRVIDLHGRLDRVSCTTCRHSSDRAGWQRRLEERNASWINLDAPVGPDGDADLDGVDFAGFDVPGCPRCGGVVKPDVVFFGESVPPWRHTRTTAALTTSDAMLVVGSSLMVQSGYRHVAAAAQLGKPVAAVNLGRTRADHLFTLKVEAAVGATLAGLVSGD